jgi:hypothetical protein
MIRYKAVCSNHNYESPSYKEEYRAKKAASSHRNSKSGTHNLEIVEEYIPSNAIEIKSRKPY